MKTSGNLPHLRTIITLFIIAGIFGLFIWLPNRKAPVSDDTRVVIEPEIVEKVVTPYIDSDGDGLQDWEETLWGTDPFLADSDGDGISDTAEVLEQQGNLELTIDNVSSRVPDAPLTETDKFARDLYASISSIDTLGIFDDPNTALYQGTVTKLLEFIPADTFSVADIQTVTPSVETVTLYYNQTGAIFNNNITNSEIIQQINIYLTNDTLTTDEANLFVSQEALRLRNVAGTLALLSVPENIVAVHVGILNQSLRLAFILEYLLDTTSDPIVSYSALASYQPTVDQLFQDYYQLGAYFEQYAFLVQ